MITIIQRREYDAIVDDAIVEYSHCDAMVDYCNTVLKDSWQ